MSNNTDVPYPEMTRIWVEVPGGDAKAEELIHRLKVAPPGSNIEHKLDGMAIAEPISRAFYIPYKNADEPRQGNTGKFLKQHGFVFKHMGFDQRGQYAVFGPCD